MKIAVLGSAGSSVGRAPFNNEKHAEWVQGKVESIARAHDFVPGDWDIWGCSPGCWAVVPRATRWFELHRWEMNVPWFSPEYMQFLRDFKGPVYTGGRVPEIPGHVVYPIESIEAKFSSYFLTSSLALMMALAIEEIEQIRKARAKWAHFGDRTNVFGADLLPTGVSRDELQRTESDDVIGLWGVDMSAGDEYAFQRPGCQFFVLEAGRRGIGTYLPAESDLMRPMPVYGISEWDHNYIKLTSKARELNAAAAAERAKLETAKLQIAGLEGEQHALNYFVSTWTNPYGMMPGLVNRMEGGLGSGITSVDTRPVERMNLAPPVLTPQAEVIKAMGEATFTMSPKTNTFIPASLEDNPYRNTPQYHAQLQNLPEPLRSQLLKGDWKAGLTDRTILGMDSSGKIFSATPVKRKKHTSAGKKRR